MPSGRSATFLAGALAVVACRTPSTSTETPAASDDASSAGPAESEDASATRGDHMHLEGDGIQKDVWTQGWTSIPHPTHREYAYAGNLGCAGQRFKTNLTKNTRLDIGYTAHKAFVIVGEDPYVLAKPPVVEANTLVWAGDFTNPSGNVRRFRLRFDCPLPPK